MHSPGGAQPNTAETWTSPRCSTTSTDTLLRWRRSLTSTLAPLSCRSRSTMSSRNDGRLGLRRRISFAAGSNWSPIDCSISVNGRARGPAAAPALKTAEQFRQPPHLHIVSGIKQTFEHAIEAVFEPAAGEPERNQRIVVRPNRAVVIGHRIIARLARGNGADAPAGEEFCSCHGLAHLAGAFGRRNAGKQHLAGIGAAHPALLFVAVERERIHSDVRAPEARVEASREIVGLSVEPMRLVRHAETFGATRRKALGVESVALHLHKRDRPLGEPAVGMKDGIRRILPALVGKSILRRALIFDEAVAVEVAELIHPGKRCLDRWPQLGESRLIPGAFDIKAGEP